ncbi:Crp/Fnr family transcriptional regulator [Fluviispira sanaruensis]|uniref:Transcriptional regulator n=1 Tax=Fluviispira sanaruensis TaxID=2493639 RepID=A0A4P2VWL4_FLUSA|nr:Crp/Fnr family transcriptional regulator [Fluviispira sanaruensis]BBH53352.1 transcriptional regulator [Fluviispira sanaruensis]
MKKNPKGHSFKKFASFFPTLNEEEIELLYQSSSELSVKKEQNIFIAGEKSYSIYLIVSGCVKFTREFEKDKTIISSLAKEGDSFGVLEIFSKSPYFERTCTAITHCDYFAVPNVAIFGIAEKNPSLYFDFLKRLSNVSSRLYNRIEGVRYKSAKQRLASCFLDFSPYLKNKSLYKKALLSRSDFADLADMTPETVSRVFAELKRMGAVEGSISDFNILDQNILKEISEFNNLRN